jgi:MFS family permease
MIRNLAVLAIAQIISMSGVAALLLLGGIIGTRLAPSPTLSTLSVSLMVVGLAAFTVPAALLMQRFGRRRGFAVSAALAALATLGAAGAVAIESFWLFCAATFVIGAQGAFVQQYRFAAIESVPPRAAGRAVSIVLLGGVVAGYLGPELATRSAHWLAAGPYVGSLVLQALLYLVAGVVLLGLRDLPPPAVEDRPSGRALREIVRQPIFLLAVIAATTSYTVMSFIMTATPLELHAVRSYDLHDTAWVIQSHIIAMFLPSLVTGVLIERHGVLPVMMAGTACLAACVAGALVSEHLMHYWGALVLLGVGWNFQFVAATVLLSRAAAPSERFRTQAVNDFVVFGAQALASLSAGVVLFAAGWRTLNLMTVPLLVLTVVMALRGRHAARAGTRA